MAISDYYDDSLNAIEEMSGEEALEAICAVYAAIQMESEGLIPTERGYLDPDMVVLEHLQDKLMRLLRRGERGDA